MKKTLYFFIIIICILFFDCFDCFAQNRSLKAVLVVGPIDGDDGDWTAREIYNADLLSDKLESYGVHVYKFYTPNNDWKDIVEASNGANFFLYRGHGREAGGFILKNQTIDIYRIQYDLKLAENSIVMIYACFSAGSSFPLESYDIDETTAFQRVSRYSAPFVMSGSAGYYADWYHNAFPIFIDDLFSGKTLGEAYTNFNFDENTLTRLFHPDNVKYDVFLDTHKFFNTTIYDHTFVGKSELKLYDLFNYTNSYIPLVVMQ